ncbi:hypothetical protein NOR_08406 [Metarhizium rileyi]|uniref:Uncharacterized protein n=1 Tax=Metarhizium rileyi (strain RCEF 4871) TaxID=1649241 RepID=A0A166WB52_METRR|nr:hypothetical protein NOR_08406 [Metarhizium rileyi RCEF 4871]
MALRNWATVVLTLASGISALAVVSDRDVIMGYTVVSKEQGEEYNAAGTLTVPLKKHEDESDAHISIWTVPMKDWSVVIRPSLEWYSPDGNDNDWFCITRASKAALVKVHKTWMPDRISESEWKMFTEQYSAGLGKMLALFYDAHAGPSMAIPHDLLKGNELGISVHCDPKVTKLPPKKIDALSRLWMKTIVPDDFKKIRDEGKDKDEKDDEDEGDDEDEEDEEDEGDNEDEKDDEDEGDNEDEKDDEVEKDDEDEGDNEDEGDDEDEKDEDKKKKKKKDEDKKKDDDVMDVANQVTPSSITSSQAPSAQIPKASQTLKTLQTFGTDKFKKPCKVKDTTRY